ncbi:sorting nexin-15 [Larimichthys crocea]|uniref:sorting nexin-15 n=1 Tax=Larimichthys crocea TaxID=215358 RepID=UPI000F5F445A|nr:sorting nexin-15 [Larimichthys crocea]
MSRKAKDEYYRFFTVSDPRSHEKGHTEYKVTARFVSKRHPEDVKEVVVWRRFSELKKLHGELAYTHKNLFRRQEEFPPFPRAHVFGRFDEAVIEERRKATEAMLSFTTTIPALYNSPQLKDFFRGGEVTRPLDSTPLSSAGPLPPPLIPLPKRRASDCEPAEEEEGREAPTLPQDLGINVGLEVGEPEVAAEAYSEMGGSPREEEQEELSDAELDDRGPSPDPSLARNHQSQESQEEFDSLFDSVAEEHVPSLKEEGPPPLSDNDLAVFDPCYKQGDNNSCPSVTRRCEGGGRVEGFSELKKLHGELAYTHKNLFRRQEEFPPFPRAHVFGRFDEAVIEERRKATEAMLSFTTTIPALYNSPQLKDFFRGGEVTRPLDSTPLSSAGPLPPPLIPLPKRRASDCEPAEERGGREAPTLPQDLGINVGLEVGEPEVAAEAYSEMGALLEKRARGAQRYGSNPSGDHSELFSLPPTSLDGGDAAYLNQAATELTAAMEREKEGEFSCAIRGYRTAVDILITGVQGDPDPIRRESVMRRTAQYLKHTEMLVDRHSSPTHTHTSTQDP